MGFAYISFSRPENYVLSCTFVLAVLYTILAVICCYQIGRIFYYRHRLLSFHSMFLHLCLLLCILRFTLFYFYFFISDLPVFLLYRIPFTIVIATFTLVVFYYASVVYRRRWESTPWIFFLVYGSINLVFLIFSIVIGVFEWKYEAVDWPLWFAIFYVFPYILMFGSLALSLAFFGWKIINRYKKGYPRQWKASSIKVVVVTTALATIFTLRAVLAIVNSLDTLSIEALNVNGIAANIMGVAVLIFFELLPCLLVVFLFWKVTTSSLVSHHASSTADQQPLLFKDNAVSYAHTPTSLSSGRTSLFNNPQRYDSDEEETEESASVSISHRPPPSMMLCNAEGLPLGVHANAQTTYIPSSIPYEPPYTCSPQGFAPSGKPKLAACFSHLDESS
mmetsp:Transcript_6985/g.17656  ORF Transcript_6985/g.17656 Transcript_6985/m.17656 type:complete len:391 (+) Transcript_6985:403-1575(+)